MLIGAHLRSNVVSELGLQVWVGLGIVVTAAANAMTPNWAEGLSDGVIGRLSLVVGSMPFQMCEYVPVCFVPPAPKSKKFSLLKCQLSCGSVRLIRTAFFNHFLVRTFWRFGCTTWSMPHH